MIKKGEKDRKRAFEKNNIGSLLIGAKGFLPDFKNPGEKIIDGLKEKSIKQRRIFSLAMLLRFSKIQPQLIRFMECFLIFHMLQDRFHTYTSCHA